MDFSDVHRTKVFEYAEEKYGAAHVARLGTVSMFGPRGVLKAVGQGLRIPAWRSEKIVESLIERAAGDERVHKTLEDTLNNTDQGMKLREEYPELLTVTHLEGHPVNASQHAAGVVITESVLQEYVAMDGRTKAIWCDKKDAETLNLLKIDALGLTQLSIFERCMELIGEKPVSGWLEKIPLDDPKAFQILNDGHYSGIFQWGTAVRGLSSQIKITSFEDMTALVSIARPGPLSTGGAQSWVNRRNGMELVADLHPLLTELTKDTYGVVIYQETVMRIVREMGQMSWEDTSAIRKAISKSLGEEHFEKYWIKFLKGATAQGVPEQMALEVWNQIKTFGAYAFNRSHAVAYAMVSYWCCWLKAHHPVEFAAATLDAEKDP